MPEEQILQTLATLGDSLNNKKSLEEVVSAFEMVVEFAQKTYGLTQDEIENLRSMFVEAQQELKTGNVERFDTLKARLTSYCENEISRMKKSHEDMMKMCENKMGEMKDGEDADEEIIVGKVVSILDEREANKPEEVEETPNDVIDTINKADNFIDKERVEGFDGIIKGLEDKISSIPRGGGAAPRSNNSTKFYPLTADGSTKIFTVPKSVASIVLMSDFPHILFEGSGFTINGTRTQITLTVDNAPALGSQLLYQYSSQFN